MNIRKNGFTIVELLVVIVIIGILASITIISYTGISNKATVASIKSDLSSASIQIKMFQAIDSSGNYPVGVDCSVSPAANTVCLKTSSGNSFIYNPLNSNNPKTFVLESANGAVKYRITSNSSPVAMSSLSCPSGFIVVPGSATYGTSDFCVMKYEARNAGSNIPVSQPSGLPWVAMNQASAISYAPSVVGCTGCHLITEAEWMTIAQNVLSVANNWNTGVVGSGYIYSGHNDSAPNTFMVADASDTNGYAGETNTGGNQLRTLILTNGEVIWDLSGNVMEWTQGTATSTEPGINGNGYAFRQWTAITNPGSLSVNASPSGTGIAGAGSWNTSNGIGGIMSNSDESVQRGFIRGGNFGPNGDAGVLSLNLTYAPTVINSYLGFRVAR